MASECRLEIYEEIKKTGCFSALIDESKDKGKREELAFAVRYYLEGRVIERFVAIVMLTEFDVQNNSDSAVMISLGADGASVMSGEFSGVAQRLRSTYFAWLHSLYSASAQSSSERSNKVIIRDELYQFFVCLAESGKSEVRI